MSGGDAFAAYVVQRHLDVVVEEVDDDAELGDVVIVTLRSVDGSAAVTYADRPDRAPRVGEVVHVFIARDEAQDEP